MPDNLSRFIDAQAKHYPMALAEIRSGRKRSHWMWYIFPQLAGLGFSSLSVEYGIRDLEEAKAFLKHPVLGLRLREISQALKELPGNDATAILGTPDDLKCRSCMTLFEAADPKEEVFRLVLKKYFNGEGDTRTLELLSH